MILLTDAALSKPVLAHYFLEYFESKFSLSCLDEKLNMDLYMFYSFKDLTSSFGLPIFIFYMKPIYMGKLKNKPFIQRRGVRGRAEFKYFFEGRDTRSNFKIRDLFGCLMKQKGASPYSLSLSSAL
jgi:hypothetical protein